MIYKSIIIRILSVILLIFLNSVIYAATTAGKTIEDHDIAEIFKQHNLQGTMIIASDNESYIYNHERANTPLSPASTFKIPNSIIALEEYVLKDQYEIIQWDGIKYEIEEWNKDQNLKTAFRASCVWFYQELAKKIGKEKYLKWLTEFNYGNSLTDKELTNFWLIDGDLRITPLQQIEFLYKLYYKQLPISERTYTILKDIMLEEEKKNYKIYSKTGAATKNWHGHGWYIGYIETGNKIWFFATNILIKGKEDLLKRKDIVMEALKKKGGL